MLEMVLIIIGIASLFIYAVKPDKTIYTEFDFYLKRLKKVFKKKKKAKK